VACVSDVDLAVAAIALGPEITEACAAAEGGAGDFCGEAACGVLGAFVSDSLPSFCLETFCSLAQSPDGPRGLCEDTVFRAALAASATKVCWKVSSITTTTSTTTIVALAMEPVISTSPSAAGFTEGPVFFMLIVLAPASCCICASGLVVLYVRKSKNSASKVGSMPGQASSEEKEAAWEEATASSQGPAFTSGRPHEAQARSSDRMAEKQSSQTRTGPTEQRPSSDSPGATAKPQATHASSPKTRPAWESSQKPAAPSEGRRASAPAASAPKYHQQSEERREATDRARRTYSFSDDANAPRGTHSKTSSSDANRQPRRNSSNGTSTTNPSGSHARSSDNATSGKNATSAAASADPPPAIDTPTELAAELNRQRAGNNLAARRRFFKDQCLRWHPDKNSEDVDRATKMFQLLQEKKDWFLAADA